MSIDKYLPASLHSPAEKAAFLMLAASVSLALVSIAASQLLLAGAIAASIYLGRKNPPAFENGIRPFLPLLAYIGWTLIAVMASPDAVRGLATTKKFFLLSVLVICPLILRRGTGKAAWICRAVFLTAVLTAAAGLAQFLVDPDRDLLHRITGFMGHWMTFSGLLMLALVLLTAYSIHSGLRSLKWGVPAAAIMIAALLLSQTRSAWLGLLAGVFLLVILWRPRILVLLIPAVVIFYFLSPGLVKNRIQTGMNPADPNTRNRIELVGTSMKLIKDNPWFGVGPKLVSREALKYRVTDDFPDSLYIHMHNNFLQIAAEMGIPGLLLWLWFMGQLAWDALRCHRAAKHSDALDEPTRKEALMASSAALGSIAALLVAGMFEYNFGDSEVLTLFLFIAGAPYAFLAQIRKQPHLRAKTETAQTV